MFSRSRYLPHQSPRKCERKGTWGDRHGLGQGVDAGPGHVLACLCSLWTTVTLWNSFFHSRDEQIKFPGKYSKRAGSC